MPILVGIDGTGADFSPGTARNERYDEAFKDSFVSRLCKGRPNAQYNRGPVALGGQLNVAIRDGLDFITQRQRILGENEPILLTGYSRGALGVLVIAQRLQRQNKNVKAALLFDCVDRHGDYDAEVVPNNIENVMHVIRNPSGGSRGSFGNDAMKYRKPTKYLGPYMFMCTHGGMGGTPWDIPDDKKGTDFIKESFPDGKTRITYDQDKRVSDELWIYCQGFIRTHNF